MCAPIHKKQFRSNLFRLVDKVFIQSPNRRTRHVFVLNSPCEMSRGPQRAPVWAQKIAIPGKPLDRVPKRIKSTGDRLLMNLRVPIAGEKNLHLSICDSYHDL